MRMQTTPMRTAMPSEEWTRLGSDPQPARGDRIRTRAAVIGLISILVLGIGAFFLYGNASSSYADAGATQNGSAASLFDTIDQAADDALDASATTPGAAKNGAMETSSSTSTAGENSSAYDMDADPTDQAASGTDAASMSRGTGDSNTIFDADDSGNVACAS